MMISDLKRLKELETEKIADWKQCMRILIWTINF